MWLGDALLDSTVPDLWVVIIYGYIYAMACCWQCPGYKVLWDDISLNLSPHFIDMVHTEVYKAEEFPTELNFWFPMTNDKLSRWR